MSGEPSEASTVCSDCGAQIECCELCGDEPCPHALCLNCPSLAVGHSVPRRHTHGVHGLGMVSAGVGETTVPVLSRRGLPCPWLRQRLLWSHPEQPYDERWQENTAGKGGACRT